MGMKKKLLVTLALAVGLLPAAVSIPAADAKAASIKMLLNGQILESDVPPYIKSETALVPLKVISQGIGAGVVWNQAAKTVTITSDLHTIVLTLKSKSALVDGLPIQMDMPMQAVSGRTLAPLRFVGEQLGMDVNWNQANYTITLNSKNLQQPAPGNGGGAAISSNTVRGAWIASVSNIDWPSSSSRGNEAKQKQELITMLDRLKETGINTVFLQVRPNADALYPSSLVPWSQYLTGTAGKDPGYDPLDFAVTEAHNRGMSIQAWFNPFRAATSTDTSKLAAGSVALEHSDWIVKQGGKLYINPGIPEARQHIMDAVMEVVNGYNIDGVALDDYFYPSAETAADPFQDNATYAAYNLNGISSKADWRRDNINTFIRDLDRSIHAAKPQLSFGVSPAGIWRNVAKDPTGSETSGLAAYDTMYADARTWIRNGTVDYIAPQVYWSFATAAAPYDKVVKWWANEVAGRSVDLYIGQAPYKIGSPDKGWQSAGEIVNQLKYNEQFTQIKGSIFYSSNSLLKNPLGLLGLLKSYYGMQ